MKGGPDGTEIIHQPEKTSIAEIILSVINELGLKINKLCATVLLPQYTLILANSDMQIISLFNAASKLTDAGAEPQEVITMLDQERPLSQKTTFLKAAQRMKWRQEGKWILATSLVKSFESGAARLLIVLGADIALVASGNKKGEMRISTRASNRIVSKGFNLATILESVAVENGGSAGGHPGAAGYNGIGDPEAITEMARQKCVSSLKQLP